MNLRLLTAAISLLALGLTPLSWGRSQVEVQVEWLPDPGQAADWDHATAEAIQAAELAQGKSGAVPTEVAALYDLLNQAGQNAVLEVLNEARPNTTPVMLSRMVADEIPFEIEALCAEGDDYERPCVALEQWGVTSIGVKAPPPGHEGEPILVHFGLRPGILPCLWECGAGQSG